MICALRCRGPRRYRLTVLLMGIAVTGGFVMGTGQSSAASVGGPFDHTHALWDRVLSEHVHNGFVNYAGLSRQRFELDRYLGALERVTPEQYRSWSRAEQLAFWINAYNAYTVRLILDHYPVKSIKDIGRFWKGPFRTVFIPLERLKGRQLTLEDIEHGILRKEWKEPRIHFAIVCASKGCPALRHEAYRAPVLEKQLNEAAQQFVRDARKNRYEASNRALYLSPIFKWFRGDFEQEAGTVAGYVARFADPDVADDIRGNSEVRIEFLAYDWSLNGS